MSNTTKAVLGLFSLAVVAACAPAEREVIYFDPAPPVQPDRPMHSKYGK